MHAIWYGWVGPTYRSHGIDVCSVCIPYGMDECDLFTDHVEYMSGMWAGHMV